MQIILLLDMQDIKGRETNSSLAMRGCDFAEDKMIIGHFYFLTDTYYEKFDKCNLMGNKESGGRPCFLCVKADELYWFVPISSKVEKYRKIYDDHKKKYKAFDGIQFGYVNGKERAFLLQNICPATEKYISEEYTVNNKTKPVVVSKELEKHIIALGRKYVKLYNDGKPIMLTKVEHIINGLKKEV